MQITTLVKDLIEKNPHMAALIVDRNGIIQFINETYLNALQLPRDKVIGKDIRRITPDSRALEVLKTGKPIQGYNWRVNGSEGIACTIPLVENGETVGAFAYSIFLDIWDKKLRDNVMQRLINSKDNQQEPFTTRYDFNSLIGVNPDFISLKTLAQNIAQHDGVTVLITGESGTGKELFAQAIHNGSIRARFPFVRVNCASIPSTLLEAELFGYEEGAYTGARKGGKQGKLELAHNGTVFLDEIGELPLSMQSKLLIFLQEREIERLGSNRPVKVNVRIIAATNRNLEKMIRKENFREDLYYRLNVARLEIPPLRHRKSDIPLLVNHFLHIISERHDICINKISKEALDLLMQYKWPGNIRELENVLERSLILANLEQDNMLLPRHVVLPIHNIGDDLADDITMSTNIKDLKTLVNQYEKMVISQILRETNNDKIQAAKFLGINLSSLYRKAKKYGIDDITET